MEREKLKLLVRNLELVLDSLKAEVYSDVDAYKPPATFSSAPLNYDEMFDDGSD